jgi:branched-chain amino acid transport system permease protein
MFDIYLLETIINGILLGGVLALLALGLNLIFGVIDVVWICYAELVMLGMYAIFFLYVKFGIPLILACLAGIAVVAVVGYLVHFLIISPILGTAPINQLLATGGLLFFLQSFTTLLFGIEFRNIGLRLPVLEVFGMYISFARLLAFCTALIGMIVLYFFLARTYDLHWNRYPGHFTRPGSDGPDGCQQPQNLPDNIRHRRRARRTGRMSAGASV